MALRQFRYIRPDPNMNQQVNTNSYTTTDTIADYAYTIALQQLVPRIAEKNKRAISVNPKYYYYFIRKTMGRKCSCVDSESTPEGQCPICWHTGIVGGYDKYGTITEVIDTTYPNITLVNVEPNFSDLTRPVMFKLSSDANIGFIETSLQLRYNIHKVDYITNVFRKIAGNTVQPYIRSSNEATYVPLTSDSLQARLSSSLVYIKVVLSRIDSTYEEPVFSHLMLRYKVKDDVRIWGDQPRRVESVALAEFGIYENFSSLSIFFDNTIEKFNTTDWLTRLDDDTRWKIIEVSPNRPLNINTSSMVTARKVQIFDIYTMFPAESI